jgi:hypothetical protein
MIQAALPIPDEISANGGDNVTELARVWWNGERPAMIIRPALTNPEMMGAVLAELSLHFSRAYAEVHRMDEAGALDAILKGWSEAHSSIAKMATAPLMPDATPDKSEEA